MLDFFPPHRGGVESLFDHLTAGLASSGNEITVLTQRLPGTRKLETRRGVRIHRIRTLGCRSLFSILAIPWAVRLGRASDLIHTTTYFSSPPTWFAGFLLKRPVLLTVCEVSGKDWHRYRGLGRIQSWIFRFLEAVILRMRFDRYACISESTRQRTLSAGVEERRTRTIYLGVDEDLFSKKGRDRAELRERLGFANRFVYLFYGRPGFSKGLEYLVDAVPAVSRQIPNALCFAIVSRDSYYLSKWDAIMKMSQAVRSTDEMRMIASVARENLPDYLLAADCVVVPSITEGFGFCVAEACAMGCPVVASNTTSIPEVVSGRYALVEPMDPSSIAEGIVAVSRGEGQTSPQKRFPWAKTVREYLDLYEETLRHEP